MMQEDELPIFNWINSTSGGVENGMNGYTYGMNRLVRKRWRCWVPTPSRAICGVFWPALCPMYSENDVELHDGETIGFAADDKHTITRSPGVGLPEEQMTLKISWASSDGDPDDGDDDPDGEVPKDEDTGVPEVYTEGEMEAVEGPSRSVSASSRMYSMSCLRRTSMWTSALCRLLRSETITSGHHGYGCSPDECAGGTGRIQAGAGGACYRAAGELETEA